MVVRFQPSKATTLSTDLVLANLVELGAAQTDETLIAGFVEEPRLGHAVGAWIGERIDQDGVDDAKDSTCGAYAEGEGEDGGQDEAGALAKFAGGILEVGE